MWKNYIEEISEGYHFRAPATSRDILRIKEELDVELSEQLLDLLSETNGVLDNSDYPLVWSTDQIIEENLFSRNFDDYKDIYMPFDHLLFFSNAGTGDLFGLAVLSGSIQKDDVYVWDHGDDSRTWVASSLKEFLKGWITEEISV